MHAPDDHIAFTGKEQDMGQISITEVDCLVQERELAETKVREMVKEMADLRQRLDGDVQKILTAIDGVRVAYITQDLQAISEAVLELSGKLGALGGCE